MSDHIYNPLRKQNVSDQEICERFAKLEARIIKLESRLKKTEAAVEYINTCYLTPNVKEKLEKILNEN